MTNEPECRLRHGYGLAWRSGGRDRYRGYKFAGRYASDEASPDLREGVQLTPGVGPGAGDGSTRTIVGRDLGLEQA
ncbi:MAG TPA: hypothetical protein VFN61_05420, partial [Acidimicrobiales bacterium]|nr:hypothetical protein [Acidimicrobiales bacterium]